MNKTRTGKMLSSALTGLAMAAAVQAAPTVTLNSVVQRYPWNNTVDAVFTVSGIENMKAHNVVIEATVDGATTTVATNRNIRADGVYTNQWTAAGGLKTTGCSAVAKLYEAPCEYMIVDLASGAVEFRDLTNGSQADSNAEYNTATCKTSKMVFRKIAGGMSHQSYSNRTTYVSRDYYVAIFPVTTGQLAYLQGGSGTGTAIADSISWDAIRGGAAVLDAPTSGLAYNLSKKASDATGESYCFDLPTACMFEIAARAETKMNFPWGDAITKDTTKAPFSYGATAGSYAPNDWGIYDVCGSATEWLRDASATSGLVDDHTRATYDGTYPPSDALDCCVTSGNYRQVHGPHYTGGSDPGLNPRYCYLSFRSALSPGSGTAGNVKFGFRLSLVVP